MANQKAAPERKDSSSDWKDLLAKAENQGKAIEAGSFWKFENLGDYAIGRILRIDEPTGKVKSVVAQLQTPDGMVRPLGLAGNLPGMIHESLIGRVVSVWYVGEKEVGQRQPMKVYRVVDHGQKFPENIPIPGVEPDGDDDMPY